MKVRAHILVDGRVQGVFFRSEVRYEARKRGVKGWVRNLPDGRVEAVFEGEEEAVKALVDFCKTGPPGARVTSVNLKWQPFLGEYKDFTIRY
ncbi:MAG: acylphosphatase [Candidatus Bathycorpusculaceae bacterium]